MSKQSEKIAKLEKKVSNLQQRNKSVRTLLDTIDISEEALVMLAHNLDPFSDALPGLAGRGASICDNYNCSTVQMVITGNYKYVAENDDKGVIELCVPGTGSFDQIISVNKSLATATAPTANDGLKQTQITTLMPTGTKYRIVAAGLRVNGDGTDQIAGYLRGCNSTTSIVTTLTSGAPTAWSDYEDMEKQWEPEVFTMKDGITVRRDFNESALLDWSVTAPATCNKPTTYMPKVEYNINSGHTFMVSAVIYVEVQVIPTSMLTHGPSPIEKNFDRLMGIMNSREYSPIVVTGHSFLNWVKMLPGKAWKAAKSLAKDTIHKIVPGGKLLTDVIGL